jgi:heat shock protein HspQ
MAKFTIGQLVEKKKGYRYPGIIRDAFPVDGDYPEDSKMRYVVEADHPDFRGMLHIFSEDQLVERGLDGDRAP